MPSALKALFSTSIYSNYFWSVLNLALSKGLRFLGVLICIRQVGMHTWGEIASTLVTITILGLVVDQGLAGTPQVFQVHRRDLDRPLLAKISAYRSVLAITVIAVLHASAAAFGNITGIVLAYSFVLLPRALAIDWLFHRREQYQLTMVIVSVRTLLFLGLVIAFVRPGTSAATVILMEILSELGGLVFSYLLLWRIGKGPGPGGGTVDLRALLLFSVPLMITAILETIPGSADIFFLRHFRGYESVGQYDIGGKIGLFYFFFGAALIQIILPKLARLHSNGDVAKMREILSASSKLLLVLSSVLMIPSFYFPGPIIGAIFKHAYPLTVFVFTWIPVWVCLSCITMLNTIVLLGAGKRREYLYGAAVASAFNIAGNWAFIGWFDDHGVVFARILSESVLFVYAYLKLPRALRGGMGPDMGVQLLNLAVLLGLFLGSARLGRPMIGFTLSLAWCAGVVVRQRTFSRPMFRVFARN